MTKTTTRNGTNKILLTESSALSLAWIHWLDYLSQSMAQRAHPVRGQDRVHLIIY